MKTKPKMLESFTSIRSKSNKNKEDPSTNPIALTVGAALFIAALTITATKLNNHVYNYKTGQVEEVKQKKDTVISGIPPNTYNPSQEKMTERYKREIDIKNSYTQNPEPTSAQSYITEPRKYRNSFNEINDISTNNSETEYPVFFKQPSGKTFIKEIRLSSHS